MFDLVLGTNNAKKVVELRLLLPEDRISLTSLAEIPESIDVDETGETFEANAALKATEQAKKLGRWVLAEDSGLSVDALGGRPGVYTVCNVCTSSVHDIRFVFRPLVARVSTSAYIVRGCQVSTQHIHHPSVAQKLTNHYRKGENKTGRC